MRFVEPDDADALQAYFRALTTRSRYNRFLGAISELPQTVLEHFIHAGEDDRFSVIATAAIEGADRIVAEARYALNAEQASVEFGLSIDDRWQGHGIGAALLRNLECRAAALGATRLFGDTLRCNEVMIALARKSGFAFTTSPSDWKLVQFRSRSTSRRRKFPVRAGGSRRKPRANRGCDEQALLPRKHRLPLLNEGLHRLAMIRCHGEADQPIGFLVAGGGKIEQSASSRLSFM